MKVKYLHLEWRVFSLTVSSSSSFSGFSVRSSKFKRIMQVSPLSPLIGTRVVWHKNFVPEIKKYIIQFFISKNKIIFIQYSKWLMNYTYTYKEFVKKKNWFISFYFKIDIPTAERIIELRIDFAVGRLIL